MKKLIIPIAIAVLFTPSFAFSKPLKQIDKSSNSKQFSLYGVSLGDSLQSAARVIPFNACSINTCKYSRIVPNAPKLFYAGATVFSIQVNLINGAIDRIKLITDDSPRKDKYSPFSFEIVLDDFRAKYGDATYVDKPSRFYDNTRRFMWLNKKNQTLTVSVGSSSYSVNLQQEDQKTINYIYKFIKNHPD